MNTYLDRRRIPIGGFAASCALPTTANRQFVTGLVLAALLVTAGCNSSVPPSPNVSTSSTTAAVPTASALTASEMGKAIEFRKTFSLRADEGWIRLVAADPASEEGRVKYGVSLSPEEVADLDQRTVAVEAIRVQVIQYGLAHPDDWAGAYIDQQREGILVAQFSDNIEQHRQALMSGLGPLARLEVMPVEYSLEYLQAEADKIHGTKDWFLTIPAYLRTYGVDEVANRIFIRISSVEPNAQDIIEEHFGWAGLTKVESDGTGAKLLPFGTLRVEARDRQGDPVAGLRCNAIPDLAVAGEPIAPETDQQGICVLELPATGYWIRLERGHGPPVQVAIGRAVVVPGGVTQLVIETP